MTYALPDQTLHDLAHDLLRVLGEHDCTACESCLHDGRKCCGCYDGACCQDSP